MKTIAHEDNKMHTSKIVSPGTSLAVQQLGLRASTAGGAGSIPGRGTKTLHAARCGQEYIHTYIPT